MFKSAEGTARFGLIAGTIGGVIPKYQVGSTIHVKFDPKDLTMVVIDHS